MIFPTYVNVDTVISLSGHSEANGTSDYKDFVVYLQGYKMKIGFKVNRAVFSNNGKRNVCYDMRRYGWSDSMLKWRSKKINNKLKYLSDFIRTSDNEKLDSFLLKKANVLVEKNMFIYRV